MKIVLFGATGVIGKKILEEAVNRGHFVRAFSRKITHQNGHPEQLEIFKGNVLNYPMVRRAVEGMDAVVSALGQRQGGKVKLMSSGTKNILRAMREQSVGRIIAVGGAGILQTSETTLVRDDADFPPFLQEVSADHLRVFHLLQKSKTNWTIVCPPFIQGEEKTGEYQVRKNYPPEGKPQLPAGDLADFILNELESSEFLCTRVGIRSL